MRLLNEVALNNVSIATSQTSAIVAVQHMPYISIQAVYTGTPTGSLVIHATCDSGTVSYTNFTSLGAGFTQALAGAAGSVIWNLSGVGYTAIKAVYTASSGTGNLTVTVNAKGG